VLGRSLRKPSGRLFSGQHTFDDVRVRGAEDPVRVISEGCLRHHDAQRELVRAPVDQSFFVSKLFGCRKKRSSWPSSCPCWRDGGVAQVAHNAEVGYHRSLAVGPKDNVVGLDVPMHQTQVSEVRNGTDELRANVQTLPHAQETLGG